MNFEKLPFLTYAHPEREISGCGTTPRRRFPSSKHFGTLLEIPSNFSVKVLETLDDCTNPYPKQLSSLLTKLTCTKQKGCQQVEVQI